LFFPFSLSVLSPTTTSAPSLRPAHPEQFPNKFSVSPGYHNHPKFSYLFSLPPPLSLSTIIKSFPLSQSSNSGGCNSRTGRCSHIRLSLST
jgi:hypothetical protein